MRIGTMFSALLVVGGLAASAGASLAGENCTCRGNGEKVPEGQTICLKTASGA
jgi:hypothetical protein